MFIFGICTIKSENNKNDSKIIPGASYYSFAWRQGKDYYGFYTYDGNLLFTYPRQQMNHDYYETLLDPSAPKPQPATYYIKYDHGYRIEFFDKNGNLLQSEHYDINDKKIYYYDRKIDFKDKSINFPTNNHKDFENFPLDLSIAKEKVNDKIIPDASYFIYSSPTAIEFYTYNGTKLHEGTRGYFDFEYLDPNAPKPQPTYYHVKTIRYDQSWAHLQGEDIVIQDLITFYDKNNNKIVTYEYDMDKKIISAEWTRGYFLDKKRNSFEFKFPADNFEGLKNFPLDLSTFPLDLIVEKEQKNEDLTDKEIIANFSTIDRIKAYSLKTINLASGIISPLAWIMLVLQKKKIIPGTIALSFLGISCITDTLLNRMKLKEHFDTKTNILFTGLGLSGGLWASLLVYLASLLDQN